MIRLARSFGLFTVCACALGPTASAQSEPTATDFPNATIVQLPVRYAADRYDVVPVTEDGDTLLLYMDTGGGGNLFYADAVESLGLPVDWLDRGSDSVGVVELPAFEIGAGIPEPSLAYHGDSLDMLFDTGATVRLTESAVARLGGGNAAERGTSFIVESVFERWRTNHPEWPVIEHAERGFDMPMIRVPEISIAGYTVGPVWFTMRSDPNFYEYMSQWMDKPVDGALGGSALQYFRIIVDYPNAVASFDRNNG